MNLEIALAFLCGILTAEIVSLAFVLYQQTRSLERFQQLEEMKEAAVQSASDKLTWPPMVS